jgi:flagellar hook-basal body complex protein FliE
MTAFSSTNFNQGVNAYNKALSNAKGLMPSKGTEKIAPTMNVLRAGDNIDVNVQSAKHSFPSIIKEIVTPPIQQIKQGEVQTKKAIVSGADHIEVMSSLNSAETALETVIAVRDKFINAYLDILKMPL